LWAGADHVESEYDPGDGAPNDVLHGNGGNDTLVSYWSPDKLYGDAGNDTLSDGDCSTKDYLYGGAGNDTLRSYAWYFGGENCGSVSPSPNVADYLDGGTEFDTAVNDYIDTLVHVESETTVG
jgi:Ca2+-binding RTX toxin-like protein